MSKLDISYHNVNFQKNLKFLKNNKKILSKTKSLLKNLASIDILKNNRLLNNTIKLVKKFKGKKNTLFFWEQVALILVLRL